MCRWTLARKVAARPLHRGDRPAVRLAHVSQAQESLGAPALPPEHRCAPRCSPASRSARRRRPTNSAAVARTSPPTGAPAPVGARRAGAPTSPPSAGPRTSGTPSSCSETPAPAPRRNGDTASGSDLGLDLRTRRWPSARAGRSQARRGRLAVPRPRTFGVARAAPAARPRAGPSAAGSRGAWERGRRSGRGHPGGAKQSRCRLATSAAAGALLGQDRRRSHNRTRLRRRSRQVRVNRPRLGPWCRSSVARPAAPARPPRGPRGARLQRGGRRATIVIRRRRCTPPTRVRGDSSVVAGRPQRCSTA